MLAAAAAPGLTHLDMHDCSCMAAQEIERGKELLWRLDRTPEAVLLQQCALIISSLHAQVCWPRLRRQGCRAWSCMTAGA